MNALVRPGKISHFALLCMLCMAVNCSCERGTDDHQSGYVSYTLDWSKLMRGYPAPQNIRYCFYPSNNGPMIQVDGDASSLRFALPVDSYKLLVYNYDAGMVEFRGMNRFDTAEAALAAPGKAVAGTDAMDPLYSIAVASFKIVEDQDQSSTLTPEPLVQNISFSIKVDGIEHITHCSGSLSGIPTAISLSQRKVVTPQTTTVPFSTTLTTDGIKGNLLIFGTPPDPEKPTPPPPETTNEVTLDFTLTDGTTLSTTADLGHQLTENNTGTDIDVNIEAVIQEEPVFTLRITAWSVAPGDHLVID